VTKYATKMAITTLSEKVKILSVQNEEMEIFGITIPTIDQRK
jgi:hypothetical protein